MCDQAVQKSINSIQLKGELQNMVYKLAVIQNLLEIPGESFTDDARMGAMISLGEIGGELLSAANEL